MVLPGAWAAGQVLAGAAGACPAGKVFCGVCANADETTPRLNTVAVVGPIQRLNVIDALSYWDSWLVNHRTEITPIAAISNGLI